MSQASGHSIKYKKSFEDVLLQLAQKNKTGVLKSTSSSKYFEIHIKEGWIVNVTGEFEEEPSIEEIIAKSGFLSEATFKKIISKISKKNVSFISYAVSRGYFSDVFLKRILENMIKERLYIILSLKNIGVMFEKGEVTPIKNLSPIYIPTFVKKYRESKSLIEKIETVIPSRDIVFKKTEGDITYYRNQGIIDAKDLVIYYFINGKRTFKDLAYISGLGSIKTGEVCLKLLKYKLIEKTKPTLEKKKKKNPFKVLFFQIVFPIALLVFLLSSVYFSPLKMGAPIIDMDTIERRQVVYVYDEAIRLYRYTYLAEVKDLNDLFTKKILRRNIWRKYKRYIMKLKR